MVMQTQSMSYKWKDQKSKKEGDKSSNPMGPHSKPLVRELMTQMWHILPKVNLNKINGFDPIGWVTQMNHYFSLHGIIYELIKLHVGVFCLDPKSWQ
jgi:hypothetical protein